MSKIHKYMIPKKEGFQIRIVDQHDGKAHHVTYGLWAGIILVLLLPSRKGKEPKHIRTKDATKAYSLMLRSLGLL